MMFEFGGYSVGVAVTVVSGSLVTYQPSGLSSADVCDCVCLVLCVLGLERQGGRSLYVCLCGGI